MTPSQEPASDSEEELGHSDTIRKDNFSTICTLTRNLSATLSWISGSRCRRVVVLVLVVVLSSAFATEPGMKGLPAGGYAHGGTQTVRRTAHRCVQCTPSRPSEAPALRSAILGPCPHLAVNPGAARRSSERRRPSHGAVRLQVGESIRVMKGFDTETVRASDGQ